MKYYYTYVLKLKNGDLYIGSGDNLEVRFRDHIYGRVESTKHFRPLELVYFEGCLTKKYATRRELQLKTGFGRGYLRRRLS